MRKTLLAAMMLTAGCVETDAELATSTTEQGVSSSLIDQGFGFGGQATGGAAANGVYVVTSTADDGSCGTLRYGVEELDGPTWIVFDPNVFPPSTKRAIYLSRALDVPSDTTIDGRGSYVSLRRTYDASNIHWIRRSNGTFECAPDEGYPVKEPILDIRSSNVIVTNLDFLQQYPLGWVSYVNETGGGGGTTNLDTVSYTEIDADCYGDAISIWRPGTEIWIDHNDFYRCGDGCVDVRNYEASAAGPSTMTEVTISNNKFSTTNEGMAIGSSADATSTGSIKIAASVYQNRFLNVNRRQPRVEAAVALVYNNVYEDWRSFGVQVVATNLDEDLDRDDDGVRDAIIVNSRGLVEHNVFRAVSTSANAWQQKEDPENDPTTDARLWVRDNKCSGVTCNNSSFPGCGTAWYYPCTHEMRGNLINISAMTYTQARDLLRPLGGSSRTVTNDTSGNFLAYTCEPPLAP